MHYAILKIKATFCTLFLLLLITVAGCKTTKHPTSKNPGKVSTATGIPFNTEDGFQLPPFKGQVVGPNMIYVEGGTTVMGTFSEELLHAGNSDKRTVSVASFFVDEAPLTNLNWLEYLDDLRKNAAPEVYQKALPDSNVWVNTFVYNDSYVKSYLGHPGFWYYPVVGVSWVQANEYCKWRTNAVNKFLSKDSEEEYDLAEEARLPLESGITVPAYRLLTEAEWEYAARGIVGIQSKDFVQRVYPWEGLCLRGTSGVQQGKFLANFKRSKGNYKGLPGESDSNGMTSYVYQYPPNDLGLYDMVGNVNEWVYDLYRPCSNRDVSDWNPVRRDETLDPATDYDTANANSLVDNEVRVYKGGSWADCAYWLQIGTKRFLHQDSSSATIGFRCAMTSMGRQE